MSTRTQLSRATLLALALAGPAVSAGTASAEPASRPAEVIAEPATPSAIAMRWPVVGDDNGNARITVAYRRPGETAWRPAHDLFRAHPAHVSRDNRVPGGWLFAGSIVGLAPATRYEIRLALDDPDGGATERTLSLETRAEPALPAVLRERHARPRQPAETEDGSGSPDDPFRGLGAAARAAEPGDLVLLRPGIYAESGIRPNSGAPGRDIVFRGTGAAIVDGGGAETLIEIGGRRHLRIENLTLRNATVLIDAGRASDVVVQRNRFAVRKFGIRGHGASYAESQRIVVSDNDFEGWLDWPPAKPYPEIYAVSLTGAGHVVRFNRIRRVRDGVYNGSEGRLSASDIHGNDVAQCADDGIETDYADTNVRVFDNRIVDCLFGVSAQPVRGGPVYVYRNFVYNARSSPFKLHNHTSGVLIYHNTSVRRGSPFLIQPGGETVNDVTTRNNLFVGTSGPALDSTGRMVRCDFDNDGYAWLTGPLARWNGAIVPSIAAARHGDGPYGRLGAIDLGPRKPFAGALWPPGDVERETDPAGLDPRLDPDGHAIDRGVPLAGFNDMFAGQAPDLGCCEAGDPPPRYGPRPVSR
jgi:hypothetical protein